MPIKNICVVLNVVAFPSSVETKKKSKMQQKRKCRRFTNFQRSQLMKLFKIYPYLAKEEATTLSRRLAISEDRLRTWFSNKRTSLKHICSRNDKSKHIFVTVFVNGFIKTYTHVQCKTSDHLCVCISIYVCFNLSFNIIFFALIDIVLSYLIFSVS